MPILSFNPVKKTEVIQELSWNYIKQSTPQTSGNTVNILFFIQKNMQCPELLLSQISNLRDQYQFNTIVAIPDSVSIDSNHIEQVDTILEYSLTGNNDITQFNTVTLHNEMLKNLSDGWFWILKDTLLVNPKALEKILSLTKGHKQLVLLNSLTAENKLKVSLQKQVTPDSISLQNILGPTEALKKISLKQTDNFEYFFYRDLIHSTFTENVTNILATKEIHQNTTMNESMSKLLFKAYANGNRWCIELPQNTNFNSFCFEIEGYLQTIGQDVLLVDPYSFHQSEYADILELISPDFFISWSEPSALLLEKDERFGFEWCTSNHIFVHPSGIFLDDETIDQTKRRVQGFQRIKDACHHITFHDSMAQEMQKMDIGPVLSITPESENGDISAQQFIEAIIAGFTLPVVRSYDYDNDLVALKEIFASENHQLIDNALNTFLVRHASVQGYKALSHLFRQNNFKTQAFASLMEALKLDFQSEEIVSELEENGISASLLLFIKDLQNSTHGAIK